MCDAEDAQRDASGKLDSVDTISITIAKATLKNVAGKSQLQRALNLSGVAYEREVKSLMWNNIAMFSADSGNIEQAEHFRQKLDVRRGFNINIRTIAALVRAYLKIRNFEKADELFQQVLEPTLHPELGNIKPDTDFFHYMISFSAEAGEIANAERHFREMGRFKLRPKMHTFRAITDGCIATGQARRAHRWLELLVKDGCDEVPLGFDADAVMVERQYQQSTIYCHWKLNLFDSMVMKVARALTDAGHTQTANKWLGYLVECGIGPDKAPELWDHVRVAHPVDIMPTLLSSETVKAYGGSPRKGAPMVKLPARLNGETPRVRTLQPLEDNDRNALWPRATLRSDAHNGRSGLDGLVEALREGEAAGLDETELRTVRTILALEERKDEVRARLEQATVDNNFDALQSAVSEAEACGLSTEDELFKTARTTLEHEERKAKARTQIQEVMKIRGLPPLPFAPNSPPAPAPEPPPTMRSLAGRTAHSALACTVPLPPRAMQRLEGRQVNTFRRSALRA